MALKRKRSDESDSPISISTIASQSPRDASSSPTPIFQRRDEMPPWSNSGTWLRSSSSQLGSRTRKRQRDNRPDDDTIHGAPITKCLLRSSNAHSFLANTYQKLFAAARTPPASMDITSPSPILRARPPPPQRQPSLHNFWSICTPARSGMEDTIEEAPCMAACEDCEAPLPSNGDTSMHGMDDDVALGADFLCRNCHRRVCDMCAVVETGLGRDCLQCRTSRRKWVGGIGWVP